MMLDSFKGTIDATDENLPKIRNAYFENGEKLLCRIGFPKHYSEFTFMLSRVTNSETRLSGTDRSYVMVAVQGFGMYPFRLIGKDSGDIYPGYFNEKMGNFGEDLAKDIVLYLSKIVNDGNN